MFLQVTLAAQGTVANRLSF